MELRDHGGYRLEATVMLVISLPLRPFTILAATGWWNEKCWRHVIPYIVSIDLLV